MQVFRNFLIGYKHAFWKIKLHNARHILYLALETVLEWALNDIILPYHHVDRHLDFSPSMPIQKETSSESLMLYVRSFYILYPFFTSPVIFIMKVYLFLSLFMPNLTSRTWCNVTYVSLKMSKLCYSFTLFCSYHLIKKCLIKISL